MEGRLMVEAARDGKFEVLEKMLQESPTILADIKIISLEESLLHVATKSGQISFVNEFLKVDPDGAGEFDKDGFRPLDIAVIMGNLGMVKELLSINKDLVRLRGKDRRTALHYAAMKGRVDIVDELLISSPNCIEDVTVHEETALHLAVKSFQFDVFATLLKWIEQQGREAMINMGDGDENTVIHNAVLTKQHMCLELLLGENSTFKGTVNVNAENAKGLTALDIMELMILDSYDVKVMKLLQIQNGVVLKPDMSTFKQETSSKRIKQALEPVLSKNWFEYFKFQEERDSPSDTRNVLLVVAALIVTVTFQAGMTPPSGIFDPVSDTSNLNNSQPRTRIGPVGGSALAAASAIFGSHASSYLFLFTNSLGLTASVCIIIYLTARFPFQRELLISLYSMMFTYGVAVNTIIEGTEPRTQAVVYALMTLAFIFPFLQRWIPRWGKKTWRRWRRRTIKHHVELPS